MHCKNCHYFKYLTANTLATCSRLDVYIDYNSITCTLFRKKELKD